MNLYVAGDRSAAICERCRRRVETRMEFRDYMPPGWTRLVPDVLVAVCVVCDEVVAISHQSMPTINRFRPPDSGADSPAKTSFATEKRDEDYFG